MTFQEFARHQFVEATKRYVQDLRTLDDAQVSEVPSGQARKIKDFTYEVALVNRYLADRVKRDIKPFPGGDEWTVAPEGMDTVDALVKEIEEASAAMLSAFDGLTVDRQAETFEVPRQDGGTRTTSPVEIVSFAALHTMYHDAQINYFQSLKGDLEMHWD